MFSTTKIQNRYPYTQGILQNLRNITGKPFLIHDWRWTIWKKLKRKWVILSWNSHKKVYRIRHVFLIQFESSSQDNIVYIAIFQKYWRSVLNKFNYCYMEILRKMVSAFKLHIITMLTKPHKSYTIFYRQLDWPLCTINWYIENWGGINSIKKLISFFYILKHNISNFYWYHKYYINCPFYVVVIPRNILWLLQKSL